MYMTIQKYVWKASIKLPLIIKIWRKTVNLCSANLLEQIRYIDYYHNLNESQYMHEFCICFSKINIIKQDFNSHPVYWLSMGIHQANDYPKPALPVFDTLLANQHFYFYEQSLHCEIQWYCYKNKSSIITIHIYMMRSFWQKSLVKHI